MTTIETLNNGESWLSHRNKLNNNFANLNTDKLETSEFSDANIKIKYEANADTNAFTDTDKDKLDNVATDATKNDTDENLRNQLTHTWINHWVINPGSDIITINAGDNTTYDLASFDYFVNWVKYNYPWATAVSPWFFPWEQSLFLWVNDSGLFTKKNIGFTLAELDTTLILGSVNSPTSSIINVVWNNPYYLDTVQKRDYLRSETAEWPIFYQGCAKITESPSFRIIHLTPSNFLVSGI